MYYYLGACLFTRREGYPSTRTFPVLFLRRIYKAARVTRIGGLPYLRAGVALAGRLTFSLVNTPGRVNPPTRVNFLIVSRPFKCNRPLSCPGM